MLMRRQLCRILSAAVLAATFAPIAASAQTSRSPVAPRRELVEAVIREAYDKFKSDTNGKNADFSRAIPKPRLFGRIPEWVGLSVRSKVMQP